MNESQSAGEARRDLASIVLDHVEAFNQHDRRRLLAGLAPDVIWNTGRDTFTGHTALAEIFDDGLWLLDPSLIVQSLVCDGFIVAAQFIEGLTVEGIRHSFAIAGFFTTLDGIRGGGDSPVYSEQPRVRRFDPHPACSLSAVLQG